MSSFDSHLRRLERLEKALDGPSPSVAGMSEMELERIIHEGNARLRADGIDPDRLDAALDAMTPRDYAKRGLDGALESAGYRLAADGRTYIDTRAPPVLTFL